MRLLQSSLIGLAAVALTLVTSMPTWVSGQSLADVAKKEEERRKSMKEPSKVYTEKDLRPGLPVSSPPPVASTPGAASAGDASKAAPGDKSAAAGGAGSKDKPADGAAGQEAGAAKEPVKDEAYWSNRLRTLRENVNRDQVFADALQARINGLTTDFVNRDDPASRASIASDRQRAIDELDRLKRNIVDGNKAIADLEEEARRANVPAGWLR